MVMCVPPRRAQRLDDEERRHPVGKANLESGGRLHLNDEPLNEIALCSTDAARDPGDGPVKATHAAAESDICIA